MRNWSILLISALLSCRHYTGAVASVVPADTVRTDTLQPSPTYRTSRADSIVSFAKTLLGTPYKYASTDPSAGFDCSGFISYVFHHFHIDVPRSSVEFTNYGTEIPVTQARPGDLILFTGTDAAIRIVGHMGIIVRNDSEGVRFIHSSSGKEAAVIITPLNERYKARFVKVIRIVHQR